MRFILLCLLATVLFSVPAFSQDTVYMRDNDFVPRQLSVDKGDQVVWVQDGNNPHNTISGTNCQSDGIWESQLFREKGRTFTFTFDNTGEFPYYCNPHCATFDMKGTITVEGSSGIATKTQQPELNAYPNPVKDHVNVEANFQHEDQVKLSVISLQGRLLKARSLMNAQAQQSLKLDMHNLPAGSYYLRLQTNDQAVRQLFIKQ